MAGITIVFNQGNMPDEAFDVAMDLALEFVISITPVDTGALQAAWERDNSALRNDMDYAEYIDDGWSSQAPDGMSGPTEEAWPDFVAEAMAEYQANNYNPYGEAQ